MHDRYARKLRDSYSAIESMARQNNSATKTSDNPVLIFEEHVEVGKNILLYDNLVRYDGQAYDVSIASTIDPKKFFFYSTIPSNSIIDYSPALQSSKVLSNIVETPHLQFRLSSLEKIQKSDPRTVELVRHYSKSAGLHSLLD